jgi:hypothetical protein
MQTAVVSPAIAQSVTYECEVPAINNGLVTAQGQGVASAFAASRFAQSAIAMAGTAAKDYWEIGCINWGNVVASGSVALGMSFLPTNQLSGVT